MTKNLAKYFPMLKSREEVLSEIMTDPKCHCIYKNWTKEQQKHFLDFCSGARGVKILYDSFFKEVFNPEYAPQPLNRLLSVILGMRVKILKVLPVDSTRMAEESTLVAMDIVVELENGEIVNVEVQKMGYLFPGQRSACYSADLLLRQYKRVRSAHAENNTQFRYDDIKPVYTIVFFEKSPQEFHEYEDTYIHRVYPVSDSGIKLELLQKYVFIPLDIFRRVRQNKPIETEIEAWLTFLSSDAVEDIIELIEIYPEFRPLYETLYSMCENIEGVMSMFSEELYQLDKNTAEFMVDEYGRMVEEQKAMLAQLGKEIARKEDEIAQKEDEIAQKNDELTKKNDELSRKEDALRERDAIIEQLRKQLQEK